MPAPSSDPYDAFLSYSRSDVEVARTVSQELEKRGVSVFTDERIEPGQPWIAVLESAIERGGAFLQLVSEASNSSEWVARERQLALAFERTGRPLVVYPLWLGGELPGFLKIYQAVDLRPPIEAEALSGRMDRLAAAIRNQEPPPPAATVLDDLRFLAFFPQGLLEPVFRSLIAVRKLESAIGTATGKASLVTRELDGVRLVGLTLSALPAARSALAEPQAEACALLEQIEGLLRAHRPYEDADPLGPGLALLLRDELRLLLTARAGDDRWRELGHQVTWRARDALPKLLAEPDHLVIALEIMSILHEIVPPDLRERLARARLNLQIGAPDRALDMFDSMGSDLFFDDPLLSVEERIAAIQDWAKAAKDADEGRRRHAELVEGYGTALDLVESAYPQGTERELVLADLLANRATQLTIFGAGEEDWSAAEADLAAAAAVYERLDDLEHLLELEAERLSLALHRLPDQQPPGTRLMAELERVQVLAERSPPTYGLFFFYYMKGTILARAGRSDEAQRGFEAAVRIAQAQGLDSRATLARWKVLRQQLERGAIAEEEFLQQIETCKVQLLDHHGDSWSANALHKILTEDLTATALGLGRRDEARAALAEAFDLATRRAAGRSAKALGRLREILDRILEIGPDARWGATFVETRRKVLARLFDMDEWEATWDTVARWQPGEE
jgi:tetratricopeptide (TPR) repeat protein